MNFDDGSVGPTIELHVLRADGVGKAQVELNITASRSVHRSATVSVAAITALAGWLDNLWDEKPPCIVPELGLELRYSHREHIGEVFYHVLVDGKVVKLVYEQANASNCARAADLMRELAAAIDG